MALNEHSDNNTKIINILSFKIGVFDNNNKLIYLIDKSGKTMNGFPLRGASMFSIGKFSEKSDFNLIVGGDDNFLYNYKLNIGNK